MNIKVLSKFLVTIVVTCMIGLIGLSCSADQRRIDKMDNGAAISVYGDMLEPLLLPYFYVTDGTTAIDDGMNRGAAFWNESVSSTQNERTVAVPSYGTDGPTDGYIFVRAGYVGHFSPDLEFLETARLVYDERGRIETAFVTISPTVLHNPILTRAVCVHAIGHALGLADDPGPPESVDLQSIMASPVDVLGRVTDKDRQRVIEVYERATQRRIDREIPPTIPIADNQTQPFHL